MKTYLLAKMGCFWKIMSLGWATWTSCPRLETHTDLYSWTVCVLGQYVVFSHFPSRSHSVCVHAKLLHSCLMDCGLPGSSFHMDSPGNNTGVGCHALLQGIFQTQISNQHLYVPCIGRWVLYHWHHLGSPEHIDLTPNVFPTQAKVPTYTSHTETAVWYQAL